MNRKVEVIAYHGWGMSSDFWNRWDSLFGEHVTFKKNDRGYFNPPELHQFEDDDAIHVLFVQGFGMSWVPEKEWRKADLIVLFSAFNNLKDIMSKKHHLEHVITQLQAQIKTAVYKTVSLFWKELFKSGDPVVNMDDYDVRDKKLLIGDLEVYYHDLVKKIKLSKNACVILYEAEYDAISPNSQRANMKKLFGRLDRFQSFEVVGHAFPFSNADMCYQDLNEHVKIF